MTDGEFLDHIDTLPNRTLIPESDLVRLHKLARTSERYRYMHNRVRIYTKHAREQIVQQVTQRMKGYR